MLIYRITEKEDGQHLRSVLRGTMQISYSAMKSAKWENRILLNDVPAPVDRIVHVGDIVAYLLDEPAPLYVPKAFEMPLDIVYEDEYLYVLNKPAGIASQSSRQHPDDTMENALFFHEGCPDHFIYRPVNRLDKGTSGLMVVAKDSHTQYLLQKQLHTPDFERQYQAIVTGRLPQMQGKIDAPIGKEDAASVRRVVMPEGKPSATHYQVLAIQGDRTLVQLRLETGRTHQIRVHMAYLGCPVFGDFLYGQEEESLPGRFALHSAQLTLLHPYTKEPLHLEAPLPEELASLMRGDEADV